MGSPDFAVPILEALVDSIHRVVVVYAQPPRPAGRGQAPRPVPAAARAAALGIAVETPTSLKAGEAQARFAALELDVAVVAAYGLILPPPILDAPRLGCINVHASLLPRWRGAAPIQRAILAGDAETGITIMQMDAGLDSGPMLTSERLAIAADDSGRTLHDKLSQLGARMIVPALEGWAAGLLRGRPQPEAGIVYARKLSREEGRLNWRRSSHDLERQVRAFDPWPGAWFVHDGRSIKVLAALAVQGREGAAPGTVLSGATIACGQGALCLERLQRPGKAPMGAAEFLRGYALPVGTVLPAE
jgi:methionyl-tRNA formyltransferase